MLTVLWRDDPSRGLGDLPDELLRHTHRLLERGRQVLARPRFRGPLTEEDFHHLHDTTPTVCRASWSRPST
ncbi:hypothetical protein [Streptomyces xanthophaeus]|uniref:hypothetical protein n=1 Tax=Streptomyces xanthophaeus TaxID=67385 RepID=UPI00370FD62B